MNRFNIRTVASAFMALVFFVAPHAGAVAQETFPSEKLEIISTAGKTHSFTVEVASSDAQRQQGLMFRKSMGDDHGMLFDFKEDRDVMMWMRNTLIPLDMLFISKGGKITHVHPNAVPNSEDIISSNGPIRYVLELNGGAAKKLNISVGDTVKAAQIK